MGALGKLSGWFTKVNVVRTTRVLEVKPESPSVKTYRVEDKLCSKAKPGQFLMLWIPGIDEIPLSISVVGDGEVSVAVKLGGFQFL